MGNSSDAPSESCITMAVLEGQYVGAVLEGNVGERYLFERRGMEVVASIVEDNRPGYLGIVCAVYQDGTMLEQRASSRFGLEGDDLGHMAKMMDALVDDAVMVGRERLGRLVDKAPANPARFWVGTYGPEGLQVEFFDREQDYDRVVEECEGRQGGRDVYTFNHGKVEV